MKKRSFLFEKEFFSHTKKRMEEMYVKKLSVLLAVMILSGCLLQEDDEQVNVQLFNREGDQVGEAKFSERKAGVHLALEVEGLSPGFHGMHLHEKASCEAPTFQSAGNHFNPTEKEHGLLHPDGAHVGDLKNIEVKDDGKVEVEMEIADVTLKNGKANSLIAKEGTSLIITDGADDGMTQISGNSGERIVCGEVK